MAQPAGHHNDDRRPALPAARIHAVTRPFLRFLHIESASGIVLVVCMLLALAIANSPLAQAFQDLWEIHFQIGFGKKTGPFLLDFSLHHWVNDALMTLFFFVVGLEIKRELVAGELSTVQKALLPVIAAIGGMVVPAGIYLAFHHGKPSESGWGIPMATDIAFVVGIMALFGKRVPIGLKIFLLALAIVDDIGAILVIAVAYSGSPDPIALMLAILGFGIIYGLNRLGVRGVAIYFVVGACIWFAVLKSGVHPTVAGVLLGLLTPSSAWVGRDLLRDAIADVLRRVNYSGENSVNAEDFRRLEFAARESVSPLDRLMTALHPWVGFVIMPIFALANAGVSVQFTRFQDPTAIAVTLGLLVGKPIGIIGFSFLAVKLRFAQLPKGVNWRLLSGAGCLGGIGFTMSLFIANLAFPENEALLSAGKVGVLLGSVLSAGLGSLLLVIGLRNKNSD